VIDRRVALLRGVNVGSAKRIAMAELRTLVEDLGYGDVRTLLNSGNVVFTVPGAVRSDAAKRIEKAIGARLGVSTRVTVLTAKEVAAAVHDNPLASVADDLARLLVMAFPDPKAMAQLKPLLKERWAPEALSLGPRVAYLWCAEGIVKSRLWTAASRSLGDAGTARNMATMAKILALMEAS
jgi:uncharacterized protein (DUF1697 family)